jgi:insertion element IS1 protein InsB
VQVDSAEMDEMWSYVGSKKNRVWLWHAIDHKTGDILAYTFGGQAEEVLHELLDLLEEEFSIQKCYTDGNLIYAKVITPLSVYPDEAERRETHEVGKKNTQKIERVHLSLRTWVKRLARKTICFSRCLLMHKIVIGLCINVRFFGRNLFG